MWRILLLILTAFSTVSAAGGFWYLAPAGAPGMSATSLAGSPFDSYLWPGIILLVVVGGTQAAAFVLLLLRSGLAPLVTAVAAFAMLIWIVAETMLFSIPPEDPAWATMRILQIAYFAIGLAETGCVLALLGIFDRSVTSTVLRG